MHDLYRYLPPITSDYSGAASIMYDLNAFTIICDPGCCIDHFVYYDNPTYYKDPRQVYSLKLESLNVTLGNDSVFIDQIINAVNNMDEKPEHIALVGTPVPAITGIDTVGMGHEIEFDLGIPTIGVNTNGFEPYVNGIDRAARALIKKFARPKATPQADTINVLGLTPIDFGSSAYGTWLKAALEDAGFKTVRLFFQGTSFKDIAAIGEASVNLAASHAGAKVGKFLKRKFKTPYVVATPLPNIGEHLNQQIFSQIKAYAAGEEQAAADKPAATEEANELRVDTLILHDQVIGNSLRAVLEEKNPDEHIVVASFVQAASSLARPDDLFIDSEGVFMEQLAQMKPRRIIADPIVEYLVEKVFADADAMPEFIPLKYNALSGVLNEREPQGLYEDMQTLAPRLGL